MDEYLVKLWSKALAAAPTCLLVVTIGFVGFYFWSVRTFASSGEVQQLSAQYEKMSSQIMNRMDISDLQRQIASLERDIKDKNAEIIRLELLEPIGDRAQVISGIAQTLRGDITTLESQVRRHEVRLSQLNRIKDGLE